MSSLFGKEVTLDEVVIYEIPGNGWQSPGFLFITANANYFFSLDRRYTLDEQFIPVIQRVGQLNIHLPKLNRFTKSTHFNLLSSIIENMNKNRFHLI